MKTEFKVFLGMSVIIGLVSAGFVWFNIIHMSHRDIKAAKPDFTVTTEGICQEFQASTDTANLKYSQKVVQVTGEVMNVESQDTLVFVTVKGIEGFHLQFEMLTDFNAQAKALKAADQVTLKGLYVGNTYDPALAEMGLLDALVNFKKASLPANKKR